MYPAKLKPGDEIRVVSPSRSLSIISAEGRQTALQNLSDLGLRVSFAPHAEECDDFHSSPVASRLADLHQAFADPHVKGILTSIGGFNCNQLLRGLDYELIRANPKILCGFSDITALSNAIYAKTGLVTYSGPHFSTLGMQLGLEYTLEYFRKCLMDSAPYQALPAETWSDDAWYREQQKRVFIPSQGYWVIHEGQAEGTLVGGNLCTLNLLQGAEYMPSLQDSLLMVEDDSESQPEHIDRDIQSLIHLPGFEGVRGLLIGRFQNESHMEDKLLLQIIRSKPELARLPVVAKLNFGHCTPHLTFPVGGKASLRAHDGVVDFMIIEH